MVSKPATVLSLGLGPEVNSLVQLFPHNRVHSHLSTPSDDLEQNIFEMGVGE